MYVFGWTALVVITVWISLAAFIWALQNGQFSEQDRARYIPLIGNYSTVKCSKPSKLPKEVYVLIVIGVLSFMALLGCIYVGMTH